MKIFVIIASVYLAQVVFTKKLSAKELPTGFQEAFEKRDNFGKSLTLSITEKYLAKNGERVNECYKNYHSEYSLLVRTSSLYMSQAAVEFVQFFGRKNYAHYGKRLQGPLRTMADTLSKYIYYLEKFLRDGQYAELKKLIKETRNTIELNDTMITVMKNKLENHSPQYSSKVDERYQQIRKEIKAKAESLSEKLHACITKSL